MLQDPFHRTQRLIADMVLNAFAVASSRLFADSQFSEKLFDNLMATPRDRGQSLSRDCQSSWNPNVDERRRPELVSATNRTLEQYGSGRYSADSAVRE